MSRLMIQLMTCLRLAMMPAACITAAGCKGDAAAPIPVRPVLSTIVAPAPAASAAIVGTVQPQFKTDLGFRVLGRLDHTWDWAHVELPSDHPHRADRPGARLP